MPNVDTEQHPVWPEMLDSFSRMRVCDPMTVFASHLQYNTQPIMYEEKTTPGGAVTHEPNEGSVLLSVDATLNASAVLQSRFYHRHQLAKTQLIRLAGTLSSGAPGLTIRLGYFDAANGIYIENKDGNINLVFRTSVSGSLVEFPIPQSAFNIDTVNGKGSSSLDLDPDKSQLLEIDLSSLGSVRVGFWIDGFLHYVHEFSVSNLLTGSGLGTVSLPVRFEITNTTGINTGALRMIYASVISEGGLAEDSSYPMSASNGSSVLAVTTRRPILSIRSRELFNNITNRGGINPNRWSLFTEDQPVLLELVWGGVLTGASFSNVEDDHSITEVDTSATAITGGLVLDTDYISPNAKAGMKVTGEAMGEIASPYPIALDIDGAHPATPFTDNFSIVATSLEASNATTNVSAKLAWGEIY